MLLGGLKNVNFNDIDYASICIFKGIGEYVQKKIIYKHFKITE